MCDLCDDDEDLTHFIMFCPKYREIRQQCPELQQPYEEHINQVTGKFLFEELNIENKKEAL